MAATFDLVTFLPRVFEGCSLFIHLGCFAWIIYTILNCVIPAISGALTIKMHVANVMVSQVIKYIMSNCSYIFVCCCVGVET